MKKPSNEIVELGKERKNIQEIIDLGLVVDDTDLRERVKQMSRDLAIMWNNLICD